MGAAGPYQPEKMINCLIACIVSIMVLRCFWASSRLHTRLSGIWTCPKCMSFLAEFSRRSKNQYAVLVTLIEHRSFSAQASKNGFHDGDRKQPTSASRHSIRYSLEHMTEESPLYPRTCTPVILVDNDIMTL